MNGRGQCCLFVEKQFLVTLGFSDFSDFSASFRTKRRSPEGLGHPERGLQKTEMVKPVKHRKDQKTSVTCVSHCLGMVPLHPFALIFSVALSVALHWSSFFFLLRSKVVEDLLQTGPRPIWLSKSFECFGFETATKRLRGKQVEYHCNISCIILPLSHLKSILTCDVRRCTRSNPWTPVTVYVF